ncbi:hypothetical protein O1L68_21370 [Streptomyces lydicus]|nr:hypothetical protein [Streptomyces lydicus]
MVQCLRQLAGGQLAGAPQLLDDRAGQPQAVDQGGGDTARGARAAAQLLGEQAAQPVLEVVGAGEPQAGQRVGQPGQVEAVGGVGHRLAGEFGQPVGVGVQQGVLGVEVRPAHTGTGGLPGEEGAVVAPAQFRHHQRPHLAAEGGAGPGQHGPAGVDGGEARGGGGSRSGGDCRGCRGCQGCRGGGACRGAGCPGAGRWRVRRFGRQGTPRREPAYSRGSRPDGR